MDSRHFSRAIKRAAYTRSGGCCENSSCGIALPAGWGGIEYDHVIPWTISHDSSLDNCRMVCARCHLDKTLSADRPIINKNRRLRDAAIGIKRASKPLPAGRNSRIRKKLNGEVVRRLEPGEAHRELMWKLHGEFS